MMKFRRNVLRFGLVGACVLAMLAGTGTAGNNPADENWWPSEFGADDQAGVVKYITPEKVVQAAGLVKKGMTATLGMPYYNGMPLVPGRTFALSIPGGSTPTHGPLNWQGDSYQKTFMDELLTAEIGQVGTQWDGLGHPMIKVSGVDGWEDGNYFYNGFRLEDVGSPRGLQAVGNEHLAEIGFFTRGILIDIAALKGVDRLDKGYAITMADFNAALEAQGIDDASQGDMVLFRTGWNSLWKEFSPGTVCGHAQEMCTPKHPDGRDPFEPPFTPAKFLELETTSIAQLREGWLAGWDHTWTPGPLCDQGKWVEARMVMDDDEPVTTPPIPLPFEYSLLGFPAWDETCQ